MASTLRDEKFHHITYNEWGLFHPIVYYYTFYSFEMINIVCHHNKLLCNRCRGYY